MITFASKISWGKNCSSGLYARTMVHFGGYFVAPFTAVFGIKIMSERGLRDLQILECVPRLLVRLAERIQEIVFQQTKSSLLDFRAIVCDWGKLFGIAICSGLPIRLPSTNFQIHDYEYISIFRIQNTSFNWNIYKFLPHPITLKNITGASELKICIVILKISSSSHIENLSAL